MNGNEEQRCSLENDPRLRGGREGGGSCAFRSIFDFQVSERRFYAWLGLDDERFRVAVRR